MSVLITFLLANKTRFNYSEIPSNPIRLVTVPKAYSAGVTASAGTKLGHYLIPLNVNG